MEGWETVKLADICNVNYGESPARILSDEGNIPVIGTGGTERLGTDFLYEGESIIIGRKGTIDNPLYVNGKFWSIDTTYYLTNFQDIDVKWLFYFLKTIDFNLLNEATGVPSLSREALYRIKIGKPKFLPEQTAIARILSTVDKAIEKTERLIAKYQRIKTGLIHDLLTRGIDEHGRIRSEATHRFKDSPLGRIPEEWKIVRLKDCAKFLDNRRRPIKEADRQNMKGEFPYYGASGIIDYINDFIFDEELILLGEDGENILSRNLPLAFIAKGRYWVNNHAHVIKPNEDMNMGYLCMQLEAFDYAPLNTSSAQPKITKNKIEEIFIAKPFKDEQDKIAEKLNCIDNYLKTEINQLSKFLSLKTALMQDLLSGRVRVPTEMIERKVEAGEVKTA